MCFLAAAVGWKQWMGIVLSDLSGWVALFSVKRKWRWIMNKNITTILATAAIALVSGCVTAGTWVNGCYIDGPLCTVCDGMKVVAHAYGTTICSHCDGTGIEPPEETVVVENVIVDTWCPPPPPRPCWHHPRPIQHRTPPHACRPNHGGGGHHGMRPARPAAKARPAARPSAPRGGGTRGGAVRGGGMRGGGRGRR